MTMVEWVQAHYIKKGKTQLEAAKALGLRQNTLSMYCSYQRFPRHEEQQRLANLCVGLSLDAWRTEYIRHQSKGAAA